MDRAATILVCEGNAARILRRAGHAVTELADGIEAADFIMNIRPAAAVIDAILPRLSGLEVCRRVAGAAPLLLLVAGPDAAARVDGLRAGADDVLSRPYDPQELEARVEALLRRSRRAAAPRSMAEVDPLTGLPAQAELARRLERALADAAAASEPVSVMVVDLDGFGEVNGRFGRGAGDRLLKACARAIVRVCREDDLVARAGGDEFVVLLPGVHFAGSLEAAERVWREVAATRIVEGGARVSCPVSVGVASFPGKDVDTPRDLLQLAHAALARAKAEGQGICLYQHHGYLYRPEPPRMTP